MYLTKISGNYMPPQETEQAQNKTRNPRSVHQVQNGATDRNNI